MEKRFQHPPELKQGYTKFILEYHDLGYITALNDKRSTKGLNYLPRHIVVKGLSFTTKLQVIFHESCKKTTKDKRALNYYLLVEPTIQEDLFDIILRFSQHTYVMTADIVKMYRQVLITPRQ